MIESPPQAFKKIIIAEHKNFVLFLSLFLGVSAFFALMWGKQSGNLFDNLFPLLLFGIGLGAVIALPLFFVLCGVMHGVAKAAKGKATFRETYGVVGWSLMPIMFSVVFVLPLELSTLGLLLFSTNPSALEVKPIVTMVFMGLDGALLLWSVMLSATGISIAHRFRFWTGLIVTLTAAVLVTFLSMYIYSSFTI
ncbi:MAG: YIP1 family protein [Bacteroidetes bacterium]|nr:YIP1 family protein [Bacteroidota bacterium]